MKTQPLLRFILLTIRSLNRRFHPPQYLTVVLSRASRALLHLVLCVLVYLRRIGGQSGDPPPSPIGSPSTITPAGSNKPFTKDKLSPVVDPIPYTIIEEPNREIVPLDSTIAFAATPGAVYGPSNLRDARRSKQALEESRKSHHLALSRSSRNSSHTSFNSTPSVNSSVRDGESHDLALGTGATSHSPYFNPPIPLTHSRIDPSFGIETVSTIPDDASTQALSVSPSIVTYSGSIMGNPFLKRMCPVMPETTRRYDPKKIPQPAPSSSIVIPELTRQFTREMPEDTEWKIVRHREGGCYFHHENERIFTDSDMTDPTILKEATSQLKAIAEYLDDQGIRDRLPANRDLFLDFDIDPEGKTIVYYYFVDHHERLIFFLHDYDTSLLTAWDEVPLGSSPLHLGKEIEAQYWYFMQLYPTSITLSKDLISELRDTCAYWIGDVETCTTSTAPYGLQSLLEIFGMLDSMEINAGSISPGAMAMLARHMYMFAHTGFIHYHGEPHVRLNRNTPVHGEQPYKRTWLIKIISPILFFGPDSHLRLLQDAWVDRILHKTKWDEITQTMQNEWIGRVVYGSLILASSVSLLTVPGVVGGTVTVPQILSYLSTLSSITSVMLVMLLHRHHQMCGSESACQAQEYLQAQVSARFGLEPLAIHHSLPHAFLMWSVVFFLMAIVLFCFLGGNTTSIVVVGVGCLVCGVAVLSSVYRAWDSGPKPDAESPQRQPRPLPFKRTLFAQAARSVANSIGSRASGISQPPGISVVPPESWDIEMNSIDEASLTASTSQLPAVRSGE